MESRFPFLRLPSERHLWKKPSSINVGFTGHEGETIEVISPGIAFRAALAQASEVCEDCERVQFHSIGGYYIRDVGPFSMRLCRDCVPDTGLWEWTTLALRGSSPRGSRGPWVPEPSRRKYSVVAVRSTPTPPFEGGESKIDRSQGSRSSGSRKGKLPPLESVSRELPDMDSLSRSHSRSKRTVDYSVGDSRVYTPLRRGSVTCSNTPVL